MNDYEMQDAAICNSMRMRHGLFCACFALILGTLLCAVLLIPMGTRAFAENEGAIVLPAATTPSPNSDDEALAPESTPEPDETPTPLTFDLPAVPPETIASVYGESMPGLRLEVFDIDGVNFKFTLYGIGDLLSAMQEKLKGEEKDYFFRYQLRTLTEREVSLKGKLIYRSPARGEDAQIAKVSTELHCKELIYHSKHPRVESNKLSWLVGMEKWFQFDLNDIGGFEFTIYNAYDTRQKITYYFDRSVAITDILLHTSLRKGGELLVQVHDGSNLTVTITDPKLRDGYKNSPDEPGAIDPFWQVRAIVNSKQWVEMVVEGQDGQNINEMDYYAGEYHRLKDNSNQYHAEATAVAVKSYSVSGNDVMMSMTVPTEAGMNLKYLQQIAVDMNNGTVLKNNIYNVY